MSKIDTSKWEEFKVGDLFDIHPTKAYKMTNSTLMENDGKYPVVVNSSYNNGIGGYTNQQPTEKGNIITFSDTTSSDAIFYQKYPFVGYPHVQGMYPKKPFENSWGEKSFLFFLSIFRTKAINLNYDYVNKFTRDSAAEMYVLLPVDENHQPDFSYMESYMKNREIAVSASLTKLQSAKRFSKSKNAEFESWKSFVIGDLFYKLDLKIVKNNFNKKNDVSVKRTSEFSLPLVNAKHFDNGIMYYGRECDFESAEMTLDIVKNGAIATGDVYAQPQKTGVLWDAYLIRPFADLPSERVLLYLATVIEKAIKDKFSYDDKCIWAKVKKLNVRLPANSTGTPDYDYMENYMKAVESKARNVIKCLTAV